MIHMPVIQSVLAVTGNLNIEDLKVLCALFWQENMTDFNK